MSTDTHPSLKSRASPRPQTRSAPPLSAAAPPDRCRPRSKTAGTQPAWTTAAATGSSSSSNSNNNSNSSERLAKKKKKMDFTPTPPPLWCKSRGTRGSACGCRRVAQDVSDDAKRPHVHLIRIRHMQENLGRCATARTQSTLKKGGGGVLCARLR